MQQPNSIRVLIVEDNVISQKVIIATLEKAGMTFEVVSDGREAVHKFNQEKFDVVLMDFELPHYGGMSAASAIRELEKRLSKPRCPIVGISLHRSQDMRDKCMSMGMDDFLPKPFKSEDLLAKITLWTSPEAKAKANPAK